MFVVAFEYDEQAHKWEVMVSGAASELEAKQGFKAVIITASEATPKVDCNRAEMQADGRYKISVGQ